MRENTTRPSNNINLEDEILDAEDGEMIYLGNADEILADLSDSEEESDDSFVSGHRVASRDDAYLTFKGHNGPVFCCHLHPTENLAITGGEDEKAFIWNTETGEVIYEVLNHKDTVIGAAFSYDGTYVATADMSGEIQVFKITQNYKKIFEFSMGDMCWMKWHMRSAVLMAGGDSGEIYVWRIPSGECKILPGNGKRCESAELTSDGKKLFCGYDDGCVKLWDIKNSVALLDVTPEDPLSHRECVSAVTCDPDKSTYISGSEDGKVLILSDSGPVGVLDPQSGPIEVVAFCPESDLKVVASGTLNGKITIWDVAKQSIRANCKHDEADEGITSMKWLPEMTLLCGTIRGMIHGYDARSGERKLSLDGHVAEIYDLCYDKTKNILLTVSEDTTAKLFTNFL